MAIRSKSYVSNYLSENNLIKTQVNWNSFSDIKILEKNEVYVFKAETSKYYKDIGENYIQVLSEEELNKSARFAHKTDSERFIATRHLLRTILSKVCLVAPWEIEFHNSGNKKPAVNGIEFNISHSGNYILLAIGPNAVGVDIELVNSNFNYQSLLARCFSPDEFSFISNGQNEVFNFYTLWTRKEAILKASGEGLTDDMDKVICLDEKVERKREGYRLVSFKIENDYVACLATANGKNEINYLSYSCT